MKRISNNELLSLEEIEILEIEEPIQYKHDDANKLTLQLYMFSIQFYLRYKNKKDEMIFRK